MDAYTFSRDVARIYATVGHPERWEAALASVADSVGAHSGTMGIDDLRTHLPLAYVAARMDPDAFLDYSTRGQAQDPWNRALATFPRGLFYSGERVLSTRALKKTAFYSEFCLPTNVIHPAGAFLCGDGHLALRVSFQRGNGGEPFEKRTLDYLNRLRTHMVRAARLNQELFDLALGKAGFGRDRQGVFVVDDRLRCLYADRAAERLLATASWIQLRQGRLIFEPRVFHYTCQRLIASVSQPGVDSREGISATHRWGPEHWLIKALPVRSILGHQSLIGLPGNVVLVVQRESYAQPAIMARLAGTFGLTEAEREVVQGILQGRAIRAIGADRNRRLPTVRSQVRAILEKTGTCSLQELTALIWRTAD